MQDLIERLEKATGPDRELNALIFCATAPSPFSYYGDCVLAQQGGFAARVELDEIPAYTSSIDAALTLVPDGFVWDVSSGHKAALPDPPWAALWSRDLDVSAEGKTPALALCIAALRARAGKEG